MKKKSIDQRLQQQESSILPSRKKSKRLNITHLSSSICDVKSIIRILNEYSKNEYNCSSKPKNRPQLNKFQCCILSYYFYNNVPASIVETKQDVEHIIPFSSNTWNGCIDLNRLGNIVLLDEKTNKIKGNRCLTDKFIAKHKLYYFNYPSENEYENIVKDDNVDSTMFNKMCESRENAYFEFLEKSLSLDMSQ